ncbi:MAG: hypothetical protein ABSG79_22135 [Bryobacteraceae bacterium]
MKRHELIGHLQGHGCRLEREGARHSIYTNTVTGAKARHSEIDNRLALKICRELGARPVRWSSERKSTTRRHPGWSAASGFFGGRP